MPIELKEVTLPDFGVAADLPQIPAEVYVSRANELLARSKAEWVVVYADREHHANMVFLTGVEPRFEEALLILGANGRRFLVVGNESQSYVPLAGLPNIEIVLNQSMSLMGQDRTISANLAKTLEGIGIAAGKTVALVGWKYLDQTEWTGEHKTFQASAYVVDSILQVLGDRNLLSDATPILMHPASGLRTVVDIHQIAVNEWGASKASEAVRRIYGAAKAGETEYQAASRMGYCGEVLTAHLMFASASTGSPVVGLRSPTARVLAKGDGVTTAVSYWGGLSSRAALLDDQNDEFLAIAKAYFAGLIAWYEAVDVGVTGGAVHNAVVAALSEGGLGSALNPGHLVGYDEWVHSPIRPGSTEAISSGMPFQVDIIPTPIKDGWALNCEDAVVIADERLRAELAAAYPEAYARIQARRAFIERELGIVLKPSILPLSNTPLVLAPFWLRPEAILVVSK